MIFLKMLRLRKVKDPFLLSLFFLILAGAGLAWLYYLPKFRTSKEALWLAEKADAIDKISIADGLSETLLKKEGSAWVVLSEKNLPADTEKVENLLTALTELLPKELVSENENNFKNYGVGAGEAISLKVYQGEITLLDLLIGDAGPSFTQDYIRLSGQSQVYLSNNRLRSILSTKEWKNLVITNFYSDEVKEVEIKGKTFSSPEEEKFKDLIALFTSLSGQDVISQEDERFNKISFDNPKIEIKLKTESGEILIKLVQDKEGNCYLKKNEQEVFYLILKEKFEQITTAVESLPTG
ncbi:MAG: DUF4340 domain-containing protein [Patescibacteria group bacterium]|nr:DUF4340 domain-containing protein [Patescibacteria group bacterium]